MRQLEMAFLTLAKKHVKQRGFKMFLKSHGTFSFCFSTNLLKPLIGSSSVLHVYMPFFVPILDWLSTGFQIEIIFPPNLERFFSLSSNIQRCE